MKPVRVKTVQVKAGQIKLASAGPDQPATPITHAIAPRAEVPETSGAVVAKAEINKADVAKSQIAKTSDGQDGSRQDRNAAAARQPRHR